MRVTIIQRRLTHYRLSFFEKLKDHLERNGIELELVYGNPNKNELRKGDSADISWAHKVKNIYFKILGRSLCWTKLPRFVYGSDLIVITQESSLLINYIILLASKFFGYKVAFWGHGANFSTVNRDLAESFKRWYSLKVDWWFAYTGATVSIIESIGYTKERITNVENSIDSELLSKQISEIKKRNDFSSRGRFTALYIGSLYKEKRIDFLIEVCRIIKLNIPEFELIVIGDGEQREKVVQWSKKDDWVSYKGVLTGGEKAYYLAIADVILNPGVVGLVVIDSFSAGVPLITTNIKGHGPEVSYLHNGVNSLVVEFKLESYAEAVLSLWRDPERRNLLSKGSLLAGKKYTLENMVENFARGIKQVRDFDQR